MDLNDLSKHRPEVLSSYEKTEADLGADLEILKTWMKKQPHIPMDLLEDEFLEIQLIQNKFSIEKTKSKIENYCTLKGKNKYKELFEGYQDTIPSKEAQFYIPLPIMTEKFERIIFGKIWDESLYDMRKELRDVLIIREIRSRFDYNCGDIVVVDDSCCTMKLITKARVNILVDAVTLAQEAYSTRIKEVHFINKLASTLIAASKPILPEKIFGRLVAHDNVDSVKKIIPAKYLPSDYGGELKSFREMLEDWDTVVLTKKELISKYVNITAREELRIRDSTTLEEMKGTFRELHID